MISAKSVKDRLKNYAAGNGKTMLQGGIMNRGHGKPR